MQGRKNYVRNIGIFLAALIAFASVGAFPAYTGNSLMAQSLFSAFASMFLSRTMSHYLLRWQFPANVRMLLLGDLFLSAFLCIPFFAIGFCLIHFAHFPVSRPQALLGNFAIAFVSFVCGYAGNQAHLIECLKKSGEAAKEEFNLPSSSFSSSE